jgi:hypothetical protein
MVARLKPYLCHPLLRKPQGQGLASCDPSSWISRQVDGISSRDRRQGPAQVLTYGHTAGSIHIAHMTLNSVIHQTHGHR